MRVYIPTVHGDVNIRPDGDDPKKVTEVETTKLTDTEVRAVKALLEKFEVEFDEDKLEDRTFHVGENFTVVHKFLVGRLKAGKKTITAVKLTDGSMIEVHDEVQLQKLADAGQAKSAVTSSTPVRGCPMPRYEPREIRASRVLREFLNPAQLHDFEQYGAFVVLGGDSGHRFRVAHRFSRLFEDPNEYWFVKDLDTQRTYCSHRTELPPSEETLALMLAVLFRERTWLDGRENAEGLEGAGITVGLEATMPARAAQGAVPNTVYSYAPLGGSELELVCQGCGYRGPHDQMRRRLVIEDERRTVWDTRCPRCRSEDLRP